MGTCGGQGRRLQGRTGLARMKGVEGSVRGGGETEFANRADLLINHSRYRVRGPSY